MYAATPYWTFSARRSPGRLASALRTATLAGGAFLIVVFGLAHTAWGGGPTGTVGYRVQPGDTLWSIAAQRYPDADVRARVQQIETVNGLSGPGIYVGERLLLPAG